MQPDDVWDELYPDEQVSRAEELIASTITGDLRVFLVELSRLVDEMNPDVLIGVVSSLAGIAQQASAYASMLERHVWDAVEHGDEQPDRASDPPGVLAGRQVDFIARCVAALRRMRDTRGAETGWRFPWDPEDDD